MPKICTSTCRLWGSDVWGRMMRRMRLWWFVCMVSMALSRVSVDSRDSEQFHTKLHFSFELLVQSTLHMVYNIVYSILTTCVCLVCFRSLFMSKRSSVYLPIQAKKTKSKKILCLSPMKANVGASWLPGPCVWFARALIKIHEIFATRDPLERQVWVWTQRFTWTVGHRSLCPTGWRTKCCKPVGEVLEIKNNLCKWCDMFSHFSGVSTTWNAVESLSKRFKKAFQSFNFWQVAKLLEGLKVPSTEKAGSSSVLHRNRCSVIYCSEPY